MGKITTLEVLTELPGEHIEAALHMEAGRVGALLARVEEELELTGTPDDDTGDGALDLDDRRQLESLRQDCQQELDEISQALLRLDSGTYGFCERCDGRIAAERLEVKPASRLCVSCAGTPPRGISALVGTQRGGWP